MSGICIVNLKKHSLQFEKLNLLSKQLIKLALDENLGVFFNSQDYAAEIIEQAKMKTFFLISDSFIYKNCDLLILNDLADIFEIDELKAKFMSKFMFFDKIIAVLKKFEISKMEIYISNDGATDDINDFEEVVTTESELLKDFFNQFILESDTYAFGIPNIKFIIDL